ncbi:MAG: hypothetical protein ACYDHP_07860 [Ferrimicrobium sp.]
MLDHLLFDFVATLNTQLGSSMLERSGLEEQLHIDILLGDASYETSYSLPGESDPPRVRVDLSIEWPTWSQSAYRSWSLGDGLNEPLELVLEVALRFSNLRDPLGDPQRLVDALPRVSPLLLTTPFELHSVATEHGIELTTNIVEHSAEALFEATLSIDEATLETPTKLQDVAATLTAWIASLLVCASDIPLTYHQL